jgi:hypothetical protein
MMHTRLCLLLLFPCLIAGANPTTHDDPVTSPIGSKAPGLGLPGVEGKVYSVASCSETKSAGHCFYL